MFDVVSCAENFLRLLERVFGFAGREQRSGSGILFSRVNSEKRD
jgi:hypothetical protein